MKAREFKDVWMPLSGRFYRVAYHILESRADAEDAVQDLYTRLWNSRCSLNDIKNPAAYGITIIRNICLDRVRHAAAKVVSSVSVLEETRMDPDADPFKKLADKEDLGLVRSCMARLPASQWKLLKMRVIEEMSYREIARLEGMTEVNVRVQVSNSRRNLKKMIENEKRK